ncbi:FMN-dependent NADH-azoreductase [Granulicella cerasi]|uniref:FMN dependent NADH:quinone oxidoreductase n=1 Tax=Granulicella cerasi TaxID=741063 RepID=A0ABW1Z4S5_9BACT|nr:NAD(P)H-dependent oxidoreductase [Granulicella cerasi]
MATLLKVDVSTRGDWSISRKLGESYKAQWLAANAGGTVIERDLAVNPLPNVDLPWIVGAYSAPDQHLPEHKASLKPSDEVIGELLAADEVIITSPLYDFNIPAAFKQWIDHIVRINKTFSASYEGLAKGRKVTVFIAAGGNYGEGSPTAGVDFVSGYLKFIFGFIGITDVTVKLYDKTSAVLMGQQTQEEYLAANPVSLS